jgi:hypothetical protein
MEYQVYKAKIMKSDILHYVSGQSGGGTGYVDTSYTTQIFFKYDHNEREACLHIPGVFSTMENNDIGVVFGKKLAAVVNYSTGQYVDLRKPKYLSRMRYAAWFLCAIAVAVLLVAIFGEGVHEREMWTFAGLVAAILCLLLYSPTNIWRGEDFSIKHPELTDCQFYD